jgi:GntR family transcriptional regulator
MIIEVDTSSPIPPYEQIRAQVATMISSGVLGPGDRLPPVRDLAADLGLAVNTVARAYRELEAAGLVEGRVRRGTTVAGQPLTLPADELARRLTDAARAYAVTAHQIGATPQQALDALRDAVASGTFGPRNAGR